jgi:CRISPR-associated protein Cas5h
MSETPKPRSDKKQKTLDLNNNPSRVIKNNPSQPLLSNPSESSPKPIFEPSNIIVFDLLGANAHFRNIQTNSTSLTYYFPPPTTLIGLIAGIIGLQRDSYYTQFQPESIFLAIDIKTPMRKIIQTVNYRVFDENGYSQIPIEIVIPETDSELCYRIYFSHSDPSIYNTVLDKIKENKSVYPPYMGIAPFIAYTEFIGEFAIEKVQINTEINIDSIIQVGNYNIVEKSNDLILYPESMRSQFYANRKPGQIRSYFYIAKGFLRIKMQESNPFYNVKLKESSVTICRL